MKVVVAEKPSVARELAAFLGARGRRAGYLEGNGWQVTWAFGHLVELKEPQDYDAAWKRWSLDTLPMVPRRFELRVARGDGVREQFEVIRTLLHGADEIVCATDAGREGELIFRYIQTLAGADGRPHRRLWLSSLTEEAIRQGFAALRDGAEFDRLYAAARCRSEADWIVGINATRNYTVRSGRDVLWSVGRVQTPVLALICARDDEIRAFVPTAFHELLTRYRGARFKRREGRFDAAEPAHAELARVRGHPFTVTQVQARTERVPPPLLHDLTELQREMNRRFGLPAAQTLEAAQALYEAKLITYPRTDSRHLTADMREPVAGVLRSLARQEPEAVAALDLRDLQDGGRVFRDAGVTDHHAIIPTGRDPGALSERDLKVYQAIVRRLIAAFHPPCVKEVTTVDGDANGVAFQARGVRVVEKGWTALLDVEEPKARRRTAKTGAPPAAGPPEDAASLTDEDEQELPAFTVGESGPHEPYLREGKTKPPAHYTENSLLAAMETAGRLVDDERLKEALKDRGLGTPATRAAIIETLLQRRYIRREGKRLLATDLGRYLIALVRDPLLKSPEMTGEWEGKLKDIERGSLDPAAFMEEIAAYIRRLIEESGFAAVDRTRLGPCPRCGKPVIEGRRAFGCSGWKEGCAFVLEKTWRGLTFHHRQVQELLQLRLLPYEVRLPAEERFAVLVLNDAGVLLALDPPRREQQKDGGTPAAAPRSRGRAAAPAAEKAGSTGLAPLPAESSARATAPARPKEERKPVCPRCAGPMVEQERAYRCGRWRDGCAFAIDKVIAGKKISKPTARALLLRGRTQVLKGFTSPNGQPFAARLKLVDGSVRVDLATGEET